MKCIIGSICLAEAPTISEQVENSGPGLAAMLSGLCTKLNFFLFIPNGSEISELRSRLYMKSYLYPFATSSRFDLLCFQKLWVNLTHFKKK